MRTVSSPAGTQLKRRPGRLPGSATFIRPSNRLSSGTSFLSALRSKYAYSAPSDPSSSTSDVRVFPNTSFSRDIEAVGLEKVGKKLADPKALREVGLEGEEISRACDEGGEVLRRELEGFSSE